jgi:glycosyltransferase involved in cell wall biosynthesis
MASGMTIHIIAAALPPQLNGIGDYTAQLAAAMAGSIRLKVLTVTGQPHRPIPGVAIEPVFSIAEPHSVRQIARHVEADRPDWLLLQYQPFAYGRWGLNPHLPLTIADIKRRSPETRIAVMVHEPFVRIECWKTAIQTSWQRWQLWKLGRSADLMLFSIEAWARTFRSWFPEKPVLHLPVGSNIPLVRMPRDEIRARLRIPEQTMVLGLFGTTHPSRLLLPVRRAAETAQRAGWDVLVLYMGPHALRLREAMGNLPVLAEGQLPAEEISRRFAALDVYFAPFSDGVSTRRTTLMTGLQHGAAVIGTRGPLTDSILREHDGRSLLLADVDTPAELGSLALRLLDDVSLRARLGHAAQALYQREFSWEQCSSRLLAAMETGWPSALLSEARSAA